MTPCTNNLHRFPQSCLFYIAIILLIAGCHSAQVEHPLTETLAGNDPDTQLEFWHAMIERPITSNDEAFHGLILFVADEDPADDYQGRVAWLLERKMLPKGFDRPANEAVQRGTLAVAMARILNIKGGVMMRLFGPSPRYATREMLYLNLLPPSSPQQTFSGTEFLGVVGRVEDYQRVSHPVQEKSLREPGKPDKP